MAQVTEAVRRIHLRTSHKIALAVVGALSALATLFDFHGFHYRLDLDVYRVGAQRVLDGLELYSGHFPIVGDIKLPFTYPPISALLFTPLTVLPYTASSVLLTLATVALTWWVLAYTLHSAARLDRKSAGWLAVGLAAVLVHLSPIHTSITYGQINVLLMAMVFADAFVVPRRFRGLLTGLAVSIKLTPAVFGLWFLLRKDWGSVVRMGLGTVGATALAWLIMPRDSLKYWTETLRETGRIGGEEYALNQSLNGLLYRLGLRAKTGGETGVGGQVGEIFGAEASGAGANTNGVTPSADAGSNISNAGSDIAAHGTNTSSGADGTNNGVMHAAANVAAHGAQLWMVLVILALIAVVFVMVRLLRANAPIAALSVNAVFALLASPISWSHHWSWAPVLLVAIGCYAFNSNAFSGHDFIEGRDSRSEHRPLRGPRWIWAILLIVGFAAFALEPTTLVPYNNQNELHWNFWQQIVGNAYLWWALIALALLGWFARAPRPSRATESPRATD